ncbi:MAG: hypothetical protein ACRDSN_16585, partial [Pseudonocardiaceae bacterium]
MPEHRQVVVAPDAFQAQAYDLTHPAPGGHDRFPHVPQSVVVGVMVGGEPLQVGLVGQGFGHVVGEGAAGAHG